jgi:hypothetical protein
VTPPPAQNLCLESSAESLQRPIRQKALTNQYRTQREEISVLNFVQSTPKFKKEKIFKIIKKKKKNWFSIVFVFLSTPRENESSDWLRPSQKIECRHVARKERRKNEKQDCACRRLRDILLL